MPIRLVSFLLTVAFVGIIGIGISYIARGYRLDTKNLGLKPTGLLVVTSNPDAAQIFVNGTLESATNATISLPPDTYDITIKKEGYISWEKRLTIKKEEVTQVDTTLFPVAPSLSALTFGGAVSPIPSPDGTRLVFGVMPNTNDDTGKVGIWVLELGNLPIGFSSEPRHITNFPPQDAEWEWSPDSRQILITTNLATYLVSTGSFTADRDLVNIRGARLEKVIAEWKKELEARKIDELSNLPEPVKDLLERKVESYAFSPDKTKILYIASSSAELKDDLIPQIPGSSTQKQERSIKPYNTYVYDIKEDRNFYIMDIKSVINIQKLKNIGQVNLVYWFPTSLNIMLAENNKVSIFDYDGTNRQVVWSGPYVSPFAHPSPNGQRLLLLTPLGAGSPNYPNIYALSLK